MGRFRVYINPFDTLGNFTGYQQVSEDVDLSSIGTLTEKLDNDEYSVGQFKFNSVTLKLRNDHGKYSDIDSTTSIFNFRRTGSKVKITWEPGIYPPVCGVAVAGAGLGATLTEEITVFEGLLDDDSTKLNIEDQQIAFSILSIDAIFDNVEAPFASLDATDLYSEAIYIILNQTEITKYLTVDPANISTDLDQAFDDIADYENKTVKEVLDDILFQANSVLYIRDNVVYVDDRNGGAASVFTFVGQGSNDGLENLQKISEIKNGLHRVFNYWRWEDTTLVQFNADSITDYGLRKSDVSFDAITNTTKRNAILSALLAQFKDKKLRFEVTVKVDVDTISLKVLDQVRVDYPTRYISGNGSSEVPIYGASTYGDAVYPKGIFSLLINVTTPLKIMGRKINFKKHEIVFKLEEI